MKSGYIFIAFLLISLSYLACIDEISFDIGSNATSVVVEGLISNELREYSIRVNESTVLGQGIDNIKTPISGAQVKVIESGGLVYDFVEDPEEPGSYKSEMKGHVGESYHVEVILPGGDLIMSEPETILAPVEIDTIPIRIDQESGLNASGNSEILSFVVASVNTTFDPNDKPYLRWRVDGEYEFQELAPGLLFPRRCYVRDFIDFNNIAIQNTNDLNDNRIIGQDVVRTTLNRRFHVIYGFMVTQYRISQREYDYWSQVDQLINIDGTLFDPPPANIIGNLVNITNPASQIKGYFSVVSESFKRQFVETGDLGFFVQTDCSQFNFRPGPPECGDCTMIRNSSLDKPDYWPF